jgi:hypothetical protein
MVKNDSTALRERDDSKLLVKWTDIDGHAFTESTETHDISETGISFYLKSPIWIDTHLNLTIASSSLFGRLQTKCAKVVRIQTDALGRQLVGARFNE